MLMPKTTIYKYYCFIFGKHNIRTSGKTSHIFPIAKTLGKEILSYFFLGLCIFASDARCFLQALFPQKCRLNSSKLHGEFPHYCISSSGTLSGAGEESLQAYKVY